MSEKLSKGKKSSRSKITIQVSIGILISGLTLWLSFRTISLSDVLAVFSQVNWFFILLGLGCVLINNLSKAWRWAFLIGSSDKKISYKSILAALMIGQMINLVVPSRLGEVTRAIQVGGLGPGRSFILGTIVLEKVLDMLGYGVLFVFMLLTVTLPDWLRQTGIGFLFMTLLITGSLAFIVFKQDWFRKILDFCFRIIPSRFRNFLVPRILAGLNSLSQLKDWKTLVVLVLWTSFIWLTAVFTNYLIAQSLRISLPWSAYVLILLSLQAGISIPSVPGRIGVFEYICVLVLALYGVEKQIAVSYGLLLHIVVLLPVIMTGVVLMGNPGLWQKKAL